MRDGVVLLADHWYPRTGSTGLPTALIRVPYGRTRATASQMARPPAERGFQVLVQSTRGTFGSGGTFYFEQQRRYAVVVLEGAHHPVPLLGRGAAVQERDAVQVELGRQMAGQQVAHHPVLGEHQCPLARGHHLAEHLGGSFELSGASGELPRVGVLGAEVLGGMVADLFEVGEQPQDVALAADAGAQAQPLRARVERLVHRGPVQLGLFRGQVARHRRLQLGGQFDPPVRARTPASAPGPRRGTACPATTCSRAQRAATDQAYTDLSSRVPSSLGASWASARSTSLSGTSSAGTSASASRPPRAAMWAVDRGPASRPPGRGGPLTRHPPPGPPCPRRPCAPAPAGGRPVRTSPADDVAVQGFPLHSSSRPVLRGARGRRPPREPEVYAGDDEQL
ncbi:CocE/NonD family hydrolase [Streptomyces sp. NPDC001100]